MTPGPGGGSPLIGVKAGGDDDAIHFIAEDGELTICGMEAASRNICKEAGDVDCWTCQRWGRGDRIVP